MSERRGSWWVLGLAVGLAGPSAALAQASTVQVGAPGVSEPRAPSRAGVALVGRLESSTGAVQVTTQGAHPAQAGESLPVGARVQTAAGEALVAAGNARLRLANNTSLVMFAPAAPQPRGAPLVTDTTLTRGTVRASMAPSTGAPAGPGLPLATPSTRIVLGAGEVVVAVDGARTTRVMALRGTVRVRVGSRMVTVREGQGLRVAARPLPVRPAPLPAPPRWNVAPPRALFSAGEPVAFGGTFAAAPAPAPSRARAAEPASPITQWHIQIARDERFEDLVRDETVPAAQLRFDAPAVAPGRYYVRVSAVDSARMEGTPGEVAAVHIAAPRFVPGGQGRRASAEMPAGFSADSTAARSRPRACRFSSAPAARIACVVVPADGAGSTEVTLNAAQSGPLLRRITQQPAGFSPAGGQRTLVLQLTDGAGLPVGYADVRATASEGATMHAIRESETRGMYTGTVQWRPGVREVRVHFTVNGAEEFDYTLGQ